MVKCGLMPITNTGPILWVPLLAFFSSSEITYLVDELRNRVDLRRFAHVGQIPSASAVYRFLSRIIEDQVRCADQRAVLDLVRPPPLNLPH